MGAASNDNWREGLPEDRDKLFLKDKLLVPKDRVEDFIDHLQNAQLMHQDEINCRRTWSPSFCSLRVITQF